MVLACPACNGTAYRRLFSLGAFSVVQCTNCQLAKLSPQPTPQELKEHYQNRGTENYSLEIAKFRDPPLHYLYKRIVPHALATRGNWLDLGCFDGGLLNFAKRDGYTTYGVDMQRSAVEVARQNHGQENIVLSDTFTGHFKKNGMQVISAISVIEHLLAPEDIFVTAQEYLSDDGLLAVQTPVITSLPGRILGSFWPCLSAPEHTYYFSDTAMHLMAEAHGFQVVKKYRHIKKLPVGYGFHQLQYFGENLYRKIHWLQKFIPKQMVLPVYLGEALFLAQRKGRA